ncbi:phospholipase domain-containing protein [Dyella terrae]|uniref:phospholipase domain-containing protein n=1 Tax=Dyella terrae TaxID=522259 RepID=UPI001EFD7866|nr:phospholipase domain-containing protein [Dyella terrae]ULU26097.1 phospholipase C, phosphocholine-specific [Dyella terrae]
MNASGMYFMADRAKLLLPNDRDTSDVRPWGMGPRVPMYVISPWSRGGWVNSQVFDHTSVGMFLETRFGIDIKAISPWHRAVSGDLTSALDFASPNHASWPQLPDMSDYATIEQRARELPKATPPAQPEPLWQETGVRYSRALPYELEVSASPVNGALHLEFNNTGKQGAVFHVYDRLHLDRLPRRYTVEAGEHLDDDAWRPVVADNGQYDIEVHAPNGFFRAFKGDINRPGVQMALSHDAKAGSIVLDISNAGADEITTEIVHNAYRNQSSPVRLAAGGKTRLSWLLEDSKYWYDLTARAPGSEQRFAGRVETGRSSISDPAA